MNDGAAINQAVAASLKTRGGSRALVAGWGSPVWCRPSHPCSVLRSIARLYKPLIRAKVRFRGAELPIEAGSRGGGVPHFGHCLPHAAGHTNAARSVGHNDRPRSRSSVLQVSHKTLAACGHRPLRFDYWFGMTTACSRRRLQDGRDYRSALKIRALPVK